VIAMRRIDLSEKGAQIVRRRALVGGIDPARIERARNNGSTRTTDKRRLLAAMADELRRLGRQPVFISRF
jgi:hypothetical protein